MDRPGLSYLETLGEWKGGGDFTLGNIRRVLFALGEPQEFVPVIHIAGTNGKGSVSAAISSILGAGGFKVALNISPHLIRINERIVIDGWSVSDDLLDECANEVRLTVGRLGVFLSFHEVVTVCAFLVAKKCRADFLVLEVGLGGRLDSSNVVLRPRVTAITSIDFDHQHILGSTLSAIAREKAGIARSNVPMVIGPLHADALVACREVCEGIGSQRIELGRDYSVEAPDGNGQATVRFGQWKVHFKPALPGVHQYQNMAVAVVCGLLAGATEDQCKQGVEGVHWPGRLELCESGGGKYLIDCAHNPAGIRALTSHLDRLKLGKVTMIFGVLETKDYREMIEELTPFVHRWCLVTPRSVRAVHSDTLAKMVRDNVSSSEIRIDSFDDDYAACLGSASFQSRVDDYNGAEICCIAGSMYMVGAIRSLLIQRERPLWVRAEKGAGGGI
jgi:dihydrofolate synthase / folylpolyglutamate synthase